MQTIVEIPKTEEQIRWVWGMGFKSTEQEIVQVVIKLPEDTYKDIIKNGFIYDEDNEVVTYAIKNGTPIPDNATNGDVIKAIFKPNWIRRMDDVVREEYEFDADWWNAPYERG